jgi:tmRNA-binding protein
MSLLEGCKNIIEKYNIIDEDKTFILDLYKDCKNNFEQNCIDQDTVEEYENISQWIINYTNDNNLLELKTELKQAYDPFRTEGYVIVPKNLYSEKEILEQQKKSDKFRFDYTKLHTDDEPSEPRDEIAVLTESDEE